MSPNVVIAEEGAISQAMYIVHHGELEVLRGNEVVGFIRDGDCFGEFSLLSLEPRHQSTVRTRTMCHIFKVTCIAFMRALMSFPAERRQFERIRMDHLAGQEKKSQRCRFKPPRLVSQDPEPRRMNRLLQPTPQAVESMEQSIEQSVEVVGESLASPVIDIDSLPPRWWRNCQANSTVEDDVFTTHLKRSLRLDGKRGFRIPGACATICREDESKTIFPDMPLDLGLLPPISTMCPLQKRVVQHYIDIRSKPRLQKKTTMRVEVCT